MTKDELLAAIRRDRALLDALVAGLDGAQMLDPALDGGWSVKDALAHISAWERLCAKWLREGRPAEGAFTQESIDAFNQGIFDGSKDQALDASREESRESHEAMLAIVRTLSEVDLADDKRFGWPTWQMVSVNSDAHYREHIAQIEAWLQGTGA